MCQKVSEKYPRDNSVVRHKCHLRQIHLTWRFTSQAIRFFKSYPHHHLWWLLKLIKLLISADEQLASYIVWDVGQVEVSKSNVNALARLILIYLFSVE